ncbi:MAG: hypothetical protein EOP84_35095 [Verrucomicrobiaceae bacterium]|nr:MAG: hypothetical protein EOP84_35095 [Verrucomicrobiaceae bacterium]
MSKTSDDDVEKRRDEALRRALTTTPTPHNSARAPKGEGQLPDDATDSGDAPADYLALSHSLTSCGISGRLGVGTSTHTDFPPAYDRSLGG